MFRIGRHIIDPSIVLAPMEGVTDRAFRGVIRGLGGCGLTVTEFVSSEGLTREIQDAWRMAELDPGEHPVSIQIYGRNPERMAQAARYCETLGADFVDINLGCPSKRVTSGCSGSALMREPELVREILARVADAITVPMTVKMRLGWSLESVNAPEIAAIAVESGAQMITVHGRSRMCAYKGSARWDLVRLVRDAIDVPLLVNGDITSPDTAREALSISGADGVMVGRGVMHDPWTLARIAADRAGTPFVEPTIDERRLLVHDYIARVEAQGERGRRGLSKVRKVLGYLSKGMPYAAALRARLNDVHDTDAARALVDEVFIAAAERQVA